MNPEITHDEGDYIACPWCGECLSNYLSEDIGAEDGYVDIECEHCLKEATVHILVAIYYEAKRKVDPDA